MIGTRLGHYEITGSLGRGGMGEVYRATDTKLGREVAIKTLPASLAGDRDRLARFEREAKILASLNHAHIASVYGLDEHEGRLYIAMELVAGETLEEKIKASTPPVEETLRLALQIAQALEAAHERGVVHRDLKPANVMVSRDGVVKVLDFGLAKAFSGDPNEASPAHSPALSLAMTQQGVILGTAAYMCPEQASGLATDQRADVWAFGVVVYEMLTGLPLFSGDSVPHILAGILRTDPDWSRLPKNLHPRIRLMLERCLEKRPRDRYHSIADARVDIEAALKDPRGLSFEHTAGGAAAASRPLWRRALPIAAAVIVSAGVVGAVAWVAVQTEPPPVNRFAYVVPLEHTLRNIGRQVLAVSPDGRHFAYNTNRGVFLRSLAELDARLIAGTEKNIRGLLFSADSQSLGYLSGELELERIAISGGAPVVIAELRTNLYGASWQPDDTILFADSDGVYRVAASGGTPQKLFGEEFGSGRYYGPQLLPGGEAILVTERTAGGGSWDAAEIAAYTLATGERTVLVSGGADGRYLPSGHLLYALGDTLFGLAFDADRLAVSGGPVPLVQGVMRGSTQTGVAYYGIADNGTLVYFRGGVGAAQNTLVWVDREGQEEPLDVAARAYTYAQISPDGTRLALDIRDEESDIWIFDLTRKTLQRLTFDSGLDRSPVWSPDGQRVAYTRQAEDGEDIYWQAADGSGEPELLARSAPARDVKFPSDFSPDGSAILYNIGTQDAALTTVGDAEGQTPVAATAANEYSATVSPDGRWVAYQSDESGSYEIYVRPFADAAQGGRWQVSTSGGVAPHWRRDGSELFYLREDTGDGAEVISVPIERGETFRPGTPAVLFRGAYLMPQSFRGIYDVTADGQRFLMIKRGGDNDIAAAQTIVIVENWQGELERLIPVD